MGRYRYTYPKPLKDILRDFLDDFPHRKQLKRGMILSLWAETVGSRIAAETENVHFERDRLIVHVKNPAWRQEIHMKRFSIAQKLNSRVKEDIIKEIIVRS